MEPMPSKRRGRPKRSDMESPSDNSFVYSCKKCHEVIGEGDNRWKKLSNSYGTPASTDLAPHNVSLKFNDDYQKAATGSDWEGCLVRVISCRSCDANVGLICVEAPPTKGHYIDKLAFKLAKLEILHYDDHCDPEIIESQDDSFSLPQLEVQVQSKTMLQRPSNPTAPTKLAKKLGKIEALAALPEDIQEQLDAQEKDIDRIMNLMENFRRDVHDIRGLLSTLQTEVKAKPTPAPREVSAPPSISTEEFERLENTVNDVAEKASEIDVLKMELEVMRKKIQRLEGMGAPAPKTVARASSVFTQALGGIGNSNGAGLITPSDSSHSIGEPHKGQLGNSERSASVKRAFKAPFPSIKALNNGFKSPTNSFKVPINSFRPPSNGFNAPDTTFEAPNNTFQAPKPTSQQKDQKASSGSHSRQNISSVTPRQTPTISVPLSRPVPILPKPTNTTHNAISTTNQGSRQASMVTSVPTNKRKRQPPAPPTGFVDWSSIDDDGSVLPSLEEPHMSNGAPKSKGTSQDNNKRIRREVDSSIIGPGAEEAKGRRRAEVANRDLEAQRLIEADELMS